jgi:CBS domain-containing protein
MGWVKDILAAKGGQVHTISGSATAYEAADKLVRCNVGSLVVMEEGKVAGIFTERDYLRRVTLTDLPPRSTAVREVMTPRIICVDPERSLGDCMAIMTQERIRHLPVAAAGGEIVGMISIGDLVKHLSREQEVEIRYLTSYIQGQSG